MALFGKQPDKNQKPQAVATPQVPAGAASASVVMPETKAVPGPSRSAPALSSEGRAYLDPGSKISGKLYFEGPARLDGQVEGEIVAKETLTIGEGATITAQIRAASVIVGGKVSGDISATHRVEIRPSAKVVGNLTSPLLVIQEGALFEGHCAMQPEAQEDRKVTLLSKEERLLQAAGHKTA